MEAHLTDRHPEYAHPGKVDGLTLPCDVYDATALTRAEESKFRIPTHMPFMKIQEKENLQPAGICGLKRRVESHTQHSAHSSAEASGAKKGCASR
ncbi:hypothetical protein SCLCIDRAFT_121807 [Scleroderma citrinum Foug A]|uniref:Uncharacterized protein n=1 Tax=Scleroderma citrinum Foug A TaxID=1036808 RepID=A0A0C3DLX6_9AGAM|nr:hypothetical protein SCLCIDRAFT_121807 [Scleroderma citrinum Foug A]